MTIGTGGNVTIPVSFKASPVPATHTVTVAAGTGGSVSRLANTSVQGDKFDVVAVPNPGYTFTSWTRNISTTAAATLSSTSNKTTTVTHGTSNTTVTANFSAATHTIAKAVTGSGSFTVAASAATGATVDVVATASAGHTFSGWVLSNASIASGSSATAASSKIVIGSGEGPVNVYATFTPVTRTITKSVTAGRGQIVCVATAGTGEVVSIVAIPDVGYEFDAWGTPTNATRSGTGQSATMTIGTGGNVTIPVSFKAVPADPSENTITVAPNDYVMGHTTVALNRDIPTNTFSVRAIANPGYQHTGWSRTGGATVSSTTANPVTVTHGTSNGTVTANFSALSHTITRVNTNGSITLNPTATTAATGAQVTITAGANTGYTFAGWELTNASFAPGSNAVTSPATIVVGAASGNVNIIALFTPSVQRITRSATNGTVSCPTSARTGEVIPIIATPAPGYKFTSWTITGISGTTPTTPSADITVGTSNVSVTANFEKLSTVVVLSNDINMGTVTPTAMQSESANKTFPAVATEKSGYKFVNWTVTGTGTRVSSATNKSTTVTIGTADGTVTANFDVVVPAKPSIPSTAAPYLLYWDGTKLNVGRWGSGVTQANMIFTRFGSIIGFTLTSNTDTWDANDVKFNPTGATNYGTFANVPTMYGDPDYTTSNTPEYDFVTSRHHSDVGLGKGYGDICRLVGLTPVQARNLLAAGRLDEYNSGFRLWRQNEYNFYYNANFISGTVSGKDGKFLTNAQNNTTFLPYAGGRYATGAPFPVDQGVDNMGYYWSSSVAIQAMNGYSLQFSYYASGSNPDHMSLPDAAQAVRCVPNDHVPPTLQSVRFVSNNTYLGDLTASNNVPNSYNPTTNTVSLALPGSKISVRARPKSSMTTRFVNWTATAGSFADPTNENTEYTVGPNGGTVTANFGAVIPPTPSLSRYEAPYLLYVFGSDDSYLRAGRWGYSTENLVRVMWGSLVAMGMYTNDIVYNPTINNYYSYTSLPFMNEQDAYTMSTMTYGEVVTRIHEAGSASRGKGDICRLVGLSETDARALDSVGQLWRYNSGLKIAPISDWKNMYVGDMYDPWNNSYEKATRDNTPGYQWVGDPNGETFIPYLGENTNFMTSSFSANPQGLGVSVICNPNDNNIGYGMGYIDNDVVSNSYNARYLVRCIPNN
jgi:hypothetical protein